MADADDQATSIIWVDASRAPVVARILRHVDHTVRTVAVGGPAGAEVDALATQLKCLRYDDLRQMRMSHKADFVLAASDDAWPARLLAAPDEGCTVLALEPPLHRMDDLASSTGNTRPGRHRTATALRAVADYTPATSFLQCEGWTCAADPRDLLQDAELVRYVSCGPHDDQSLFGRMFEAWHLLLTLTDLPHSIDASCSHRPPGSDLWSLSGFMAAHARYAGGFCATLDISDATGWSGRSLQVLGTGIELTVTDLAYRLRDGGGTLLESHGDIDDGTATVDELVAEHWKRRTLRTETRPETSPPIEHVLACCIAMHLSSRTGEPERPAAILAMSGHR